MKYMLFVYSNPRGFAERDEGAADMQPMIEFVAGLNQELIDSGEFVDAAGLADPAQAKTLRKQNGVVVATDGPYAETREVLGGYWLLDCASFDRAMAIATRFLEFDSPIENAVEVRPLEQG